jgi:hypothetical protein
MVVDSYTAIYMSTARAHTLLDSLTPNEVSGSANPPPNPHEVEKTVLSLANDLQAILVDAMDTATAMFPQKPFAPKRGTLP